uniref:Uncharacterized protein n=1 Tax=Panagrolaimus sp. ES5 TaxID=591445 RepID=A0AC34GBW4_9BILA
AEIAPIQIHSFGQTPSAAVDSRNQNETENVQIRSFGQTPSAAVDSRSQNEAKLTSSFMDQPPQHYVQQQRYQELPAPTNVFNPIQTQQAATPFLTQRRRGFVKVAQAPPINFAKLSEEMNLYGRRKEVSIDFEALSTSCQPPLNSLNADVQIDEHANSNAESAPVSSPLPSSLSVPTVRQYDPVVYEKKYAQLSTGIMRKFPKKYIEECAMNHAKILPPMQRPKYRGIYSTK